MPWIAFVDEELTKKLEEINSGNEEEDLFPEYSFVAVCLKVGLTINDLKELTYVEATKILISFLPKKEKKYIKATQNDWDKLANS